MLDSLRHPRQRTVSIGPQSEADAYEAMAYNARRRRASRDSAGSQTQRPHDANPALSQTSGITRNNAPRLPELPKTDGVTSPSIVLTTPSEEWKTVPFPSLDTEEDEREDQALFSKLQIPRVRYDVEVVTKLIVYCG